MQQIGLPLRSLAASFTVAILAQGTSWAVAVTQAFLLPGSILVGCTVGRLCMAWPSQVFVELFGALNVRRFLKYLVLSLRPLLGHDHERCTATVLYREKPMSFRPLLVHDHERCTAIVLYRERPKTITIGMAFPSWPRKDKARHDLWVLYSNAKS